MTENNGVMGSDLIKVDAYQNTAADYDEIPDMADADPALVMWRIGDRVVSEAEGRAAMAVARRRGRPPVNGGKEALKLRIDRDVVEAYRAAGPGWQSRMNEALRKGVGL